ncbi:MAG: hypothetical protein KU29_08705 [Sulfurovum sp. FS06-10]|nr:MAG: hypothetical protein KU29_08705 [Sulfurovum sp. FS06-10]
MGQRTPNISQIDTRVKGFESNRSNLVLIFKIPQIEVDRGYKTPLKYLFSIIPQLKIRVLLHAKTH